MVEQIDGIAVPRNDRHDGIRALAALSVLCQHLSPLDSGIKLITPGQFGIITFFVLSGFLISRNLYAAKSRIDRSVATVREEMRRFYVRRALRIAPIYYLSIVVLAVVLQRGEIRQNIWWLLTYTSNIGQMLGITMGVASHFWTLAAEEQFYLVIPLMVLLLPWRWVARVAAALMILSIVFKTVFVPPLFSELLVLRAPLNSLDALGAGMLLGFTIYTGNKLSVRFRTLFIAGLIASIVFYSMVTLKIISQPDIGLGWFAIQNLTVVWIATSLVFAAETMQLWPLKLLAWRPLVYLGKISYGIYLYHFMLIPYYPAIARFFGYQIKSPRESMWSFLFSSAVAICVAAISWHVIESPILSLKDRFSARPTATFANNLREDNQIHSV